MTDFNNQLDSLLRMKLVSLMSAFRFYGMQDFVPPTIEEIVKLCKWYNQSKQTNHVVNHQPILANTGFEERP